MIDERETFEYYLFHRRKKEIDTGKLCWNVFLERQNKIIVYNIFEHSAFYRSLVELRKHLVEIKDLEEALDHNLMYYFWSKCEYEIVISSWPSFVSSKEIDRLVQARDEHIKKYNDFIGTDVDVKGGVKIDVYTQIRMNWVAFTDYLIENWDKIE